jgi:hypothetical protein
VNVQNLYTFTDYSGWDPTCTASAAPSPAVRTTG